MAKKVTPAVVTVAFHDTLENNHHRLTVLTLNHLRQSLERLHKIVPVDNGSPDTRTWRQIYQVFPHAVRIPERIRHDRAINTGWREFEKQLLRGSMVAVNFDSGTQVVSMSSNHWLRDAQRLMRSSQRDVGIISLRHKIKDYDGSGWILRDMNWWFESNHIESGVQIRSTKGFKAIGYTHQPYGHHWDAFRIKQAGLTLAVLMSHEACPILGGIDMPGTETGSKRKLARLQQETLDDERSLFHTYDGYEGEEW